VLLPPLTPFFPPPSLLPPLPLSGYVRRARRSGGNANPAVIRDGPDGRTTKTCHGTASAAASAASEEEECNGCDGADPQRRLDDAPFAWQMGSSSARSSQRRRHGAAAAESGDRDDVDAWDQLWHVVQWAGGLGKR